MLRRISDEEIVAILNEDHVDGILVCLGEDEDLIASERKMCDAQLSADKEKMREFVEWVEKASKSYWNPKVIRGLWQSKVKELLSE